MATAKRAARTRPKASPARSPRTSQARGAVRRRARPAAAGASAASGRATSALRRATAARGRRPPSGEREAQRTTAARRDAVAGPGAEVAARRRDEEPRHLASPTAVAAEALRTGVVANAIPRRPDDQAIPGEAERIRVGDPDDEVLRNEYVGEETPGGSTPTPDQSDVDEIGRAYGVQDEDSGELRTSTEMLAGRDRRRKGVGVRRRQS